MNEDLLKTLIKSKSRHCKQCGRVIEDRPKYRYCTECAEARQRLVRTKCNKKHKVHDYPSVIVNGKKAWIHACVICGDDMYDYGSGMKKYCDKCRKNMNHEWNVKFGRIYRKMPKKTSCELCSCEIIHYCSGVPRFCKACRNLANAERNRERSHKQVKSKCQRCGVDIIDRSFYHPKKWCAACLKQVKMERLRDMNFKKTCKVCHKIPTNRNDYICKDCRKMIARRKPKAIKEMIENVGGI